MPLLENYYVRRTHTEDLKSTSVCGGVSHLPDRDTQKLKRTKDSPLTT